MPAFALASASFDSY